MLAKEYRKEKSKGYTLILGDFNARIQGKLHDEDTCSGQHTFDLECTDMDMLPDVILDSRQRLVDFAESRNSVISDTFFKTTNDKLFTYKNQKDHFGPPSVRPKDEQWTKSDHQTDGTIQ